MSDLKKTFLSIVADPLVWFLVIFPSLRIYANHGIFYSIVFSLGIVLLVTASVHLMRKYE